jgi:hydrogenase/urease accessory protein HupE
VTIVLVVALPADAHAHLVNTRLGDFYGGMLHPLTGMEDALPWFALAILAGFQGPQRAKWLLVVFPLGLFVGGYFSQVGPKLPYMPILAVGLIALIGIAVAGALVVPTPALVALGAVVSLAHGYQNGQAIAGSMDALLFIAGVTAVGYVFITLATGAVIAFLAGGGGWRPIALRASGSWVAAVGIMALGLQIFTPAA